MTVRRIVLIAPDCLHGGSVGAVAWRQSVELSRWFEVHVISVATPEPPNERVHPVLISPRRWDVLRRFCHVPNELSFQWAARRALRRLCSAVPVSAVWCHGHGSVVLAAAPLRRRHRFRVIMTTHGDIRDRPPGTYSREMTWYYRAVTCRAYRSADVTQALSPYMAEWALRGGARPEQVVAIPNGIDPAEIGLKSIQPRLPESFLPDGRLRLLFVGALLALKGVDVLLRAVAELLSGMTTLEPRDASLSGSQSTGPDTSWRTVSLTIVGDGPERGRLERLVESLGIRNDVLFTGRVPRGRLHEVYREADVLCIPSLSEALPTAGLEGMLCGLPIVGSRTGGIPAIVEEGVTGLLAAPGDPGDLVACIRNVASSRQRLTTMGTAACRRAIEHFGWRPIGEQLARLIGTQV